MPNEITRDFEAEIQTELESIAALDLAIANKSEWRSNHEKKLAAIRAEQVAAREAEKTVGRKLAEANIIPRQDRGFIDVMGYYVRHVNGLSPDELADPLQTRFASRIDAQDAKARSEEREACAKLAESHGMVWIAENIRSTSPASPPPETAGKPQPVDVEKTKTEVLEEAIRQFKGKFPEPSNRSEWAEGRRSGLEAALIILGCMLPPTDYSRV